MRLQDCRTGVGKGAVTSWQDEKGPMPRGKEEATIRRGCRTGVGQEPREEKGLTNHNLFPTSPIFCHLFKFFHTQECVSLKQKCHFGVPLFSLEV